MRGHGPSKLCVYLVWLNRQRPDNSSQLVYFVCSSNEYRSQGPCGFPRAVVLTCAAAEREGALGKPSFFCAQERATPLRMGPLATPGLIAAWYQHPLSSWTHLASAASSSVSASWSSAAASTFRRWAVGRGSLPPRIAVRNEIPQHRRDHLQVGRLVGAGEGGPLLVVVEVWPLQRRVPELVV